MARTRKVEDRERGREERRERRDQRRTERNEIPKERVTFFDGDWDERDARRWHHDRGHGSVFGAIVLAAGVLLLLNTLNIIPWRVWDNIWRFWPLLLILWGVQIILGGSWATRWLVSLISLAAVILVVLFAIHQVDPSAVRGLPPVFDQIFTSMKGLQK